MAQAMRVDAARDFAPSGTDVALARASIAGLAAARESRAEYWRDRFMTAFEESVTPHGLAAVLAGVEPADALADGFCLSAAPLFSGPHSLDYVSVEALTLRLARLLIADKAVAMEVSGARPVADAVRDGADEPFDLANLPRRLSAALERFRLAFAPAALSIRCDHPDAQRLVRSRRNASAATAQLYLRITDEFMAAVRDGRPVALHHRLEPAHGSPFGSSQARRERTWIYARVDARAWWREIVCDAHAGDTVTPVFDGRTASACPLAGPEVIDCIEPGLGQCSPADGARITLDVNLASFVNRRRQVDRLRLARSLRDALRMADNLVDAVHWPLESLHADAVAHRRIALHITGIGDTVCRLGLDPAHFATLVRMNDTLGFVRACVFRHSRALARLRSPFPGLHAARMIELLPRSDLRAEVRERIRQHATRNRELLVLSPFSVLPRESNGIDALPYFNLLPLLRFADSIGFRADPRGRRLTVDQYERFMRLAWAASMHDVRRSVS